MSRHKQKATSEATREQEYSDEIFDQMPASFQVLAKFALKRGDGIAGSNPPQ